VKSREIRKILRLIEKDPDNVELFIDLGQQYFISSRYDKAMEAYRNALRIDNRNASAYHNLGVAYQAKQKPSEAKAMFLKALEIDPNHRPSQEGLDKLLTF
jgi:tetratricopeptide (TPR) repeat protein